MHKIYSAHFNPKNTHTTDVLPLAHLFSPSPRLRYVLFHEDKTSKTVLAAMAEADELSARLTIVETVARNNADRIGVVTEVVDATKMDVTEPKERIAELENRECASPAVPCCCLCCRATVPLPHMCCSRASAFRAARDRRAGERRAGCAGLWRRRAARDARPAQVQTPSPSHGKENEGWVACMTCSAQFRPNPAFARIIYIGLVDELVPASPRLELGEY